MTQQLGDVIDFNLHMADYFLQIKVVNYLERSFWLEPKIALNKSIGKVKAALEPSGPSGRRLSLISVAWSD